MRRDFWGFASNSYAEVLVWLRTDTGDGPPLFDGRVRGKLYTARFAMQELDSFVGAPEEQGLLIHGRYDSRQNDVNGGRTSTSPHQ
jgi:hypothetical protein